jgi:flagellar protein FliS
MWNNGHDAYLESRVLSADPVELVHLLYQASIQAVGDARHHLAEGRIMERSKAITRACKINIELAAALDFEKGGELSKRLAGLYDYMRQRLLEANLKQADAPLEEVLGLLTTLGEAWETIRFGQSTAQPAVEPVISEEKPADQTERSWSEAPEESTSPWLKRTEETTCAWEQPVFATANAWPQPSAETPNPWAQPAAETTSPWAQPQAETVSPWAQPTLEIASPWAQASIEADSSWAQTEVPEPVGCGAHAWSF